jgi:hypothetical protein
MVVGIEISAINLNKYVERMARIGRVNASFNTMKGTPQLAFHVIPR